MSDNARTPLEEAALGIYMHVAERIKEGYSEEAIKAELIAQGIKPATAETMLAKLNASRDNVTRRYGNRNRTIAWICIGLGVIVALLGGSAIGWLTGAVLVLCGIYWLARATLQMKL